MTGLLYGLRAAGLRITTGEWLTLLEGLSKHLGTFDVNDFHAFARLCLIKDERLFDRFDQAFGAWWEGRTRDFDALADRFGADLPNDWLTRPDGLNDAQRAAIDAAGGWDELMKQLEERLAEQTEAHHGGNRWVGTGGTSPFGHGGRHPAGVRIGGDGGRDGRAVTIWRERRYRDLDGDVELGTRNLRIALQKLRRLAREGRADELDLDSTVRSTAGNGGVLDIRLQPERRDTVKILLLIDVGGSMDYHARRSEQLFSAARSEFRRLELFYFHNFVYESVWTSAARRTSSALETDALARHYGREHRVFIVGDATMSPWEISIPGGSVGHWNAEAGEVWLRRLQRDFPHIVWLNPEPRDRWDRTPSIELTRELMQRRMYPLTPTGLGEAIRAIKTPMLPVDKPLDAVGDSAASANATR